MAIIVEDKKSKKQYFLLGASLGIYKTSRPNMLGGNIFPYEEEGAVQSVGVCDQSGQIFFMDSNLLKVVKIDGRRLEEIGMELSEGENEWNQETMSYNFCPGCGEGIKPSDIECTSCKLRLK